MFNCTTTTIIIITFVFQLFPVTLGATCQTIDYSSFTACKEPLSKSGLTSPFAKALIDSPSGIPEEALASTYLSRLQSLLDTNLDCDCCTDETVPHSWVCEDCFETYRYWVCSALFPPCSDDDRIPADDLCIYTLQRCPPVVEFSCPDIGTH